ncbi:MAG TPA: peptidase S8, partial [Bacteroidetes bacterium]|nr:peptidase S8 [Bacteroidota bacterium]
QNYPNPFNPTTKISFSLKHSGLSTLKVYDLLGREIASLVNEYLTAGNYTIEWSGSNLSSGVYFYQIRSGDFVATKKMILQK